MRYAVEENGKLIWIDTSVKPSPKPQTREEQYASLVRRIRRIAEEYGIEDNKEKIIDKPENFNTPET